MKKISWFNSFGCPTSEGEKIISALEDDIQLFLTSYEKKVSYRDMYEMAQQAGSGAVSSMMSDHINSSWRKKKNRMKKK